MWFCPVDGTLLLVQKSEGQFFCSTCPYTQPIGRRSLKRTFPTKKANAMEDLLGGDQAFGQRTTTVCPSCSHKEAFFIQIQLRSADEPMSVFYRCCACSHQWNEK